MNNARSKASGQFQPNRSDAGHRRPSQQQQAERRAEMVRLTRGVSEGMEAVSNRIAAQMQAGQPVAVEKVDIVSAHERRMEIWRRNNQSN